MEMGKNSKMLQMLEEITRCDSPAYATKAHQMLSEINSLDEADVLTFVDAYLNDPYLTKN
jgi:hypothetical protein